MENLCAALSGHLLIGRWGTGLDPGQKIGLTVSLCSSTAENSGFRILDVPKNGGQSGFLGFGRGVAFNCREAEAILERDNSSSQRIESAAECCLYIPHRKEDAAASVATKVLVVDDDPDLREILGFVSGTGDSKLLVQAMGTTERGLPSPIAQTLYFPMS
jgi:hypothetical protein